MRGERSSPSRRGTSSPPVNRIARRERRPTMLVGLRQSHRGAAPSSLSLLWARLNSRWTGRTTLEMTWDGLSPPASYESLDVLNDKYAQIFRGVRHKAGKQRPLRIQSEETHGVEPERHREDHRRAEPGLGPDMEREAVTVPCPQERMQDGKQRRDAHHTSPQPQAATMLDDKIPAEDDLFDHGRATDRVESEQ